MRRGKAAPLVNLRTAAELRKPPGGRLAADGFLRGLTGGNRILGVPLPCPLRISIFIHAYNFFLY